MKAAQSLNASAFLVDGDKWRIVGGPPRERRGSWRADPSSRLDIAAEDEDAADTSLLDLFDDSARPGLVEARTDEANHQQLADLAGQFVADLGLGLALPLDDSHCCDNHEQEGGRDRATGGAMGAGQAAASPSQSRCIPEYRRFAGAKPGRPGMPGMTRIDTLDGRPLRARRWDRIATGPGRAGACGWALSSAWLMAWQPEQFSTTSARPRKIISLSVSSQCSAAGGNGPGQRGREGPGLLIGWAAWRCLLRSMM